MSALHPFQIALQRAGRRLTLLTLLTQSPQIGPIGSLFLGKKRSIERNLEISVSCVSSDSIQGELVAGGASLLHGTIAHAGVGSVASDANCAAERNVARAPWRPTPTGKARFLAHRAHPCHNLQQQPSAYAERCAQDAIGLSAWRWEQTTTPALGPRSSSGKSGLQHGCVPSISEERTMPTILRFPAVCRRLGLSRDSVRRRCTPASPYFDPSFPQPVRLGATSRAPLGFIEDELEQWLARRAVARRTSHRSGGEAA